ncbi:MAG: RNA polymerase sigma factor [Bacteroidetes bacterium]|nr:RNA polymerase sigma factor [Bacteroidota bacterium]
MNLLLSKKRLLNHSPDILIRGCQQNDLQSQQQLYKLCYPEMIKICYRYAKDADGAGTIYNDAMLKVFAHIGRYVDEGKLVSWIRTIVVRCSIDYCRQRHVFKPLPVQEMEELYIIDPEVLNRVTGKEIQQLVKQLPGATATVFNLFVYDGFTHKQIADILNISEGTSKWHVSEAKKLLKLKLERITETELKTNAAG